MVYFDKFKRAFYRAAAPVALTVMTAMPSLSQITLAGNGDIGCDNTNGVPATSVPLDFGMGVADALSYVVWTEPNCELIKKLDRNGNGDQTIIASGVRATAVDVKFGGTIVIFFDANDNWIKEVSINGGTITALAEATNQAGDPVSVVELEQVTNNTIRYTADGNGDGKNELFLLGGLQLLQLPGGIADFYSLGGSSRIATNSEGNTPAKLRNYSHSSGNLTFLTNLPPEPGEPLQITNVGSTDIILFENGQTGIYDQDSGEFEMTDDFFGNQNDIELDYEAGDILVTNSPAVQAYPVPQPAPLAVSWLSFDVKQEGDKALLHWRTASEINNDRFDVQISQDLQNWETIGSVKGQGTSADTHDYEFAADVTNGQNYFRIQQFDTDGTMDLSPIRTLHVTGIKSQLRLYPNPARNSVTVEGDDIHAVQVFDPMGRLAQIYNNAANDRRVTLDISALPTGIYALRTESGAGVETSRLVISR